MHKRKHIYSGHSMDKIITAKQRLFFYIVKQQTYDLQVDYLKVNYLKSIDKFTKEKI